MAQRKSAVGLLKIKRKYVISISVVLLQNDGDFSSMPAMGGHTRKCPRPSGPGHPLLCIDSHHPRIICLFLLFCCRNIPNPSSLLLSSCLLLQMLQASRWKEALPMHLHSFFQSSEVLLTELPLPELQVPELLVSLLSEHQDRRS